MHIFHVAEAARWDAAKLAGSYAWSTRGRSLADEGFIHCAREDQWQEVCRRYFGDLSDPLVLLVIDTDRLTSPWREEPVGDTTFPHVHGPLNLDAVVAAVPLSGAESAASRDAPSAPAALPPVGAPESGRPQPRGTFAEAFLGEIVFRIVLALAVMALMSIGVLLAQTFLGPDAGLIGAGIGLVVGGLAAIPVVRRRESRLARRP